MLPFRNSFCNSGIEQRFRRFDDPNTPSCLLPLFLLGKCDSGLPSISGVRGPKRRKRYIYVILRRRSTSNSACDITMQRERLSKDAIQQFVVLLWACCVAEVVSASNGAKRPEHDDGYRPRPDLPAEIAPLFWECHVTCAWTLDVGQHEIEWRHLG